jgi:hypothetical protein
LKPDTATAMRSLIGQARSKIPFDIPDAVLCSGICRGCSRKLLDFLDSELGYWECQLDNGETPSLGDVQRLAKHSMKIYQALDRSGLLNKQFD